MSALKGYLIHNVVKTMSLEAPALTHVSLNDLNQFLHSAAVLDPIAHAAGRLAPNSVLTGDIMLNGEKKSSLSYGTAVYAFTLASRVSLSSDLWVSNQIMEYDSKNFAECEN